eukprot:scaffold1527_cov143-Pinguiococcus_pyrenoidosus.AAC.7
MVAIQLESAERHARTMRVPENPVRKMRSIFRSKYSDEHIRVPDADGRREIHPGHQLERRARYTVLLIGSISTSSGSSYLSSSGGVLL